jgi:hypothetical protein
VEGTTQMATTGANGSYTLPGVDAGAVFLDVAPPTGAAYLPGETREAITVQAGKTTDSVLVHLASRPADDATYVGEATCMICHADLHTAVSGSAHGRSITQGTSHLVKTPVNLWPAVGATAVPGVTALSPVDGTTIVSVYVCQRSAGVYSMKFGGAADCTITTDGTFVPIAATYGGEGNGGITPSPVFGVHKQQFLARVLDVPAASSFAYTLGKDADYLTLPVQITQSGTGGPRWEVVDATGADGWTARTRTFSHACAGCHAGGLRIAWETTSGRSLITSYEYTELNVGCEQCHGPGSEHVEAAKADKPLHIINPKHLTAEADRQVCGKCHGADHSQSVSPAQLGYPWNDANLATIGNGSFVAGVYRLGDYLSLPGGAGFVTWPDGLHSKTERQQYPMLELSVHAQNPLHKVTCSDCHDVHGLAGGPEERDRAVGSDLYAFKRLSLRDNTACLRCHAGLGPFADLAAVDVANLHAAAGGVVQKNGVLVVPSASDATASLQKAAGAVLAHMTKEVGMSLVGYTPTDDVVPVGRCSTCHMPKTGVSGGSTTALDADGRTAVAEGDESSHVFDIVWPSQSSIMKKSVGGVDGDISPNSCGNCHAAARFSGDNL